MYVLIVQPGAGAEYQTYTFRGAKKAYAAYDTAIRLGYGVISFVGPSGISMVDCVQPAIVWGV